MQVQKVELKVRILEEFLKFLMKMFRIVKDHWRIQDFSERGANLLVQFFSKKLHDYDKNWTARGVPAPLDPPMQMAR